MSDKVKKISHSSLELLASCPRKFQIYRENALDVPSEAGNIHTAFGSAIGSGIQKLFETNNLQDAILAAFLAWDVPLNEVHAKSKKDFPSVYAAICIYKAQYLEERLEKWELAYFNGKPAVELSFIIHLPNGYKYRGFVDAVLISKDRKTFRVLEIKTTGNSTLNPAMYRNSFQGVGYGVILDKIATEHKMESDYIVEYIIYQSPTKSFSSMPFTKGALSRAKWLAQLLVHTRQIDLFIEENLFPQVGSSCFDFYRPCQYFGSCDTVEASRNYISSLPSDAEFIANWTLEPTGEKTLDKPEEKEHTIYDFELYYDELLTNQLERLDATD